MLLHIMLYVMLAYLMLFAALSNAVCFMLCLGLLAYSLFISSMIFHHALCFQSVGFS